MIKEPKHDPQQCNQRIMAVHDAMYILNGRWKISIIASLCFNTLRFSDLLREVEGISGKMLSRELKNLEENQLVTRTVLKTQPITVEYQLTEYGHTLKEVIDSLAKWGHNHRKKITGKE
ncbi:helix-turn-helix domain-containing protein [Flavobacterium sp. DG2-3]|uniref:winged helix-turn-helix transcriptional regulator n=1 Tax=Flavobacterium sp. DG2-3 TaxID=3068317 RepID=UPI00273D1E1D|nr:helix-turn-helix domain-containing protein [Flavobacterium sp. DG2-3]MDP5201793.1 helix-turn-helix domain-containing protein [Flavobacterium sp. DG2-3]